jgi:hypothetical protein
MSLHAQVVDRDLERLEILWQDGLEDGLHQTYRHFMRAVAAHDADARPKLALAAALVEVGIRLQGLGGRAAPPATLLMGDLCLARSSRLLAATATQAVQVAFARAIEQMSSAAASGKAAPPARDLLLRALEAGS